jgi:hypothetical protein
MKTVAILEVEEAREVLERLKKESIPTEIEKRKEKSGLEISEIKVPNDYYGRGCDLVEAWNAEQVAAAEKRIRLNIPRLNKAERQKAKQNRIPMLLFLVPMFFLFLAMLLYSIGQFESSNTAIGYNVYQQPVGPVIRGIVSLIALPAIAVYIWQTFRPKSKNNKSDNNQDAA